MTTVTRIVARIVGALMLLAAGLVLAGVGLNSDGGGGPFQPLGALWYALSPASLNLVQAVIERYIWEALWDPLLIGLLQWGLMSLLSGRLLAAMPIVVEQLTAAALYPVVAYVFVLTHRSILRED